MARQRKPAVAEWLRRPPQPRSWRSRSRLGGAAFGSSSRLRRETCSAIPPARTRSSHEALVDRLQLKYILTPHETGRRHGCGLHQGSGEPAIAGQAAVVGCNAIG
jgi:hypothetical protein